MTSIESYNFTPIGFVETPHADPKGAPIQPSGAKGVKGIIRLLPEYQAATSDLDGFSHLILIYAFHLSQGWQPKVTPFLDNRERGLFATRAPKRPNPIGLSVVGLEKVAQGVLHIVDVDLVDNTPLLDIKPYVPQFDSRAAAKIGWMQGKAQQAKEKKSDGRFQD